MLYKDTFWKYELLKNDWSDNASFSFTTVLLKGFLKTEVNSRVENKYVSAFWPNQIKDNRAIYQMKVEALVHLQNNNKRQFQATPRRYLFHAMCVLTAEMKPATKAQF